MRHATVRTEHADPAVVAAALRPDNTEAMETRVDGDAVLTDIERDTTGGLQATVDDYVVNLTVAAAVGDAARDHANDTTHP